MAIEDSSENRDESMVYEDLTVVEQLCERYVELHRQGKAPTVEEFAAEYEVIEAQILDLLPTVIMMEEARLRNLGHRKDGRVKRGAEQILELGDYTIIRELGRGGMGIVYEAKQRSLDRSVAIKLLPKHMLTESQVKKFQREASTAAKLHHTNIAPIYGIGEARGYHFYAMQMLKGITLDRYVASAESVHVPIEPLTVNEVVSVGRQTAQALHYAHDEGVLHRDIKPSNLLRDFRGNVWMTDFGLAASRESLGEEDAGSASGTLRYMSPEKFGGADSDVTGDIYSLAVTLMELLSGRPAFSSLRIAELTKDIKAGKHEPMTHQGRQLPADLAAILKKAVSIEPAKRYSSAKDFAADLKNFAETRPVQARRSSSTGRAIRWMKRNGALALASGLAASMLIATTVVSTSSYFNVQSALTAELDQRKRAEVSAQLASQAMDKMFGQLSGGASLFENPVSSNQTRPKLTAESAALARQLSDFYLQLASQRGQSTEYNVKALMARSRVGELDERLGRYKDSAESFRIALSGYENLLQYKKIEDSTENLIKIARLANQLGMVKNLDGDREASMAFHEKAMTMLSEKLGQQTQPDPRVTMELARSHYLVAMETRPGMGPNSFPPAAFSSTVDPAVYSDIPLGSPAEYEKDHLYVAIDLLKKNLEAKSVEGEIEPNEQMVDAANYLVALCYRELAGDVWSARTQKEARYFRQAVGLFEDLIAKYPNQTAFKLDLMRTLASINVLDSNLDVESIDEAFGALVKARGYGNELVMAQPDVASYRLEMIHCNFKLGRIIEKKKRSANPPIVSKQLEELNSLQESAFRRAMSLQGDLARNYPDSSAYRVWVGRFALSLAGCDSLIGNTENRERLISRASAILNRLPDSIAERSEVKTMLEEVNVMNRASLIETRN